MARTSQLFDEQITRVRTQVDRFFAALFVFQVFLAVALSLWLSPSTWTGTESQIHPHVWAALFSTVICSFPILLVMLRPAQTSTRHVIAVAQMIMGALLIHLTGGRIETHFHVFGSLAFLAFYRDWRVLITASLVVTVDHLVRGLFWPQSVYGVLTPTIWRTLEHAVWVAFEDAFLIVCCIRMRAELWNMCRQQAELENNNREIAVRDAALAASARQAQLVTELESANQELNDFAYVVSHDLKAPLRAIGSLASWIIADCGDRLDDDGKQHLELLLGRVKRMNNLIEGVLQYSRVGRVREKKEPTNLDTLVPEILDLLAPPDHVKVRVEAELPTVLVEKTRVSQVFHNLVSNSIKFLDKPEGHITIGCADEGDFWRFHVTDNGPGIEERHFEKVFQIFQTLQARDTVESTGIGLALVKKAVEVHGGKVWLDSQVGIGSTFYFTLPKAEWKSAAA